MEDEEGDKYIRANADFLVKNAISREYNSESYITWSLIFLTQLLVQK